MQLQTFRNFNFNKIPPHIKRPVRDRYQDTLAADAIEKVQKVCKYVNKNDHFDSNL